eukprot:gene30957-30823_t
MTVDAYVKLVRLSDYNQHYVAGNYRLDSLGWLALTELEQEAN